MFLLIIVPFSLLIRIVDDDSLQIELVSGDAMPLFLVKHVSAEVGVENVIVVEGVVVVVVVEFGHRQPWWLQCTGLLSAINS